MRSICFYVWNEYQLACFKPIIELVNGYVAVEDRAYNSDFARAVELEYSNSSRFLRLKRGAANRELDNFDLVVAHTVFEGVGLLRSAKLAFVQYGLAKENYNYGLWRGLADVNFVFGKYSQQKLAGMANSIVVGHPVLSSWQKQCFDLSLSKEERPVLYYAPTWGEHSSLESSLNDLEGLGGQFNLVVAPHHNTIVFNPNLIRQVPRNIKMALSQADKVDWLLKSNLVVSDLSGIIFDAFFLGKRVAVLRGGAFTKESEKIGRDSIEYREINKFAAVVEDISSSVREGFFPVYDPHSEYCQSLISDTLGADERLAHELINLSFSDQHRLLREKIRAHWAIADNEKKRIRSEAHSNRSIVAQKLQRLLHRIKVGV